MRPIVAEALESRTFLSVAIASAVAAPPAAAPAVLAKVAKKIKATDIVLTVNTVTGEVKITATVSGAVITAYSIGSASGSLVKFAAAGHGRYGNGSLEANASVYVLDGTKHHVNNWQGIRNTTGTLAEGEGLSYDPTDKSTWTNQTVTTKGISLGTRFKTGAKRDLVFLWSDAKLHTYSGTVRYVTK